MVLFLSLGGLSYAVLQSLIAPALPVMRTVVLLAGGAVALVVFVLVELRVAEPLVDMGLVAVRGVWSSDLVGLAFGFAMFGTFVLVPTLLELPSATGYGFGESVSGAGLFLLPTTLMMLVFGPLPLLLGAIAVTAAFALPAIAHDKVWEILASGLLTGAGIGLAFAAMSNATIASVPVTHTGEATSVNSIVRTIGGSIGSAVVAAVLASGSTARGPPTNDASTAGFWTCAAVSVVGILAALALPRRRAGGP